MNETERKAYLEQFNRRTHVLGRIVSAITLVLLVGAPFLIGTFLGAMPDMGAVAKGFLSVGLVCAYIGSYIGAFVSGEGLFTCTGDWTPLIVVAVSAAVMALFVYLSEKKNMAWLESFSIAGSMLIGMAAAVLVRL